MTDITEKTEVTDQMEGRFCGLKENILKKSWIFSWW